MESEDWSCGSRDDGKGIDAEALEQGRTGHWGMLGMRERAERIGGQFKVWSKLDAGTGIELSIPASSVYADVACPPFPPCLRRKREKEFMIANPPKVL